MRPDRDESLSLMWMGGQDRRPHGLHRLGDGLPRRPRAQTQGEVLEARPMPRIVSGCQRGRKKLGWQTELEKRFPRLLAGFHLPFWSSDRLIFTPFHENEERE